MSPLVCWLVLQGAGLELCIHFRELLFKVLLLLFVSASLLDVLTNLLSSTSDVTTTTIPSSRVGVASMSMMPGPAFFSCSMMLHLVEVCFEERLGAEGHFGWDLHLEEDMVFWVDVLGVWLTHLTEVIVHTVPAIMVSV